MRIGLHDEGLVLLTPEIPGKPSEAVRRERGENGFRGKEASRTAETRSVEAVSDEPPTAHSLPPCRKRMGRKGALGYGLVRAAGAV